jgi:hypothetical protein
MTVSMIVMQGKTQWVEQDGLEHDGLEHDGLEHDG